MGKCIFVFLSLTIIPASALSQEPATPAPLQIQILYDNVPCHKHVTTDWGFACLVTGTEKSILFDTGAKGDLLLANQKAMDVDLPSIDLVVISHNHGDHTGGLLAFLQKRPGVEVFLPASAPRSLVDSVRAAATACSVVKKPTEICRGVSILGPVSGSLRGSIVEQALVLETPRGLVVITGCAHPGIVEMTRRAKTHLKRDVYMVCGGTHLLRHSESQVKHVISQLKQLGVKKVGATHCTGDKAIKLFQQAFGDDYVPLGAGRVVKL